MLTPEQIVQAIETIKKLDPTISSRFTDEQLQTYVAIADSFIELSGNTIQSDKIVLATALKTLALLQTPENSSLSKKKIKDVEITYYKGQGKNKWDALFDALINGVSIDEKALYYVGI